MKVSLISIAVFILTMPAWRLPSTVGGSPGFVTASPGSAYLVGPDGKPFYLLGVNYVGYSDRGWQMWEEALFDLALIEKDFLKAKEAGANTLRIFIRRPIPEEVMAGKWQKLDGVVGLARKHQLFLLITFYDYGELDLSKVAEVDRRIAQRYAEERFVLGYDLKNEPHLQDLVTARYPNGQPPAFLSDALVKQYGQRLTQTEADEWRNTGPGKNVIPAWFDRQQTYLYANNYKIYTDFLAAAAAWVAARGYEVTTLDYIDSPDSSGWQVLIAALDQTLAAWLSSQVAAIRSVDSRHLLTVGYSDVVLAKLNANKTLNLQAIHRYPSEQLKPFKVGLGMLDNLKRTFAGQPVAMTEFGYATSVLDPSRSAIYESAIHLYLLSHEMAGGAKWKLNDLAAGASAKENSYGLYALGDQPKPAASAMRAIGDYVSAAPPRPGVLTLSEDPASGLRYIYSAPDALFVAGKDYQGQGVNIKSDGPNQAFLSWREPDVIRILTTARASLEIDPIALTGDPSIIPKYQLATTGEKDTAQAFEQRQQTVVFNADAGQAYLLKLARSLAEAKIEIVWPQGNLPVAQAEKANVSAYLFASGTARAACPDVTGTVRLFRSLNNGVEEPVAVGLRREVNVDNLIFAAWDFNNVDVKEARDPKNKYFFRLAVDNASGQSNIWSHGSDARTYYPQVEIPQAVLTTIPASVDAKIEIVWPLSGAPVSEATKANVGAYLFEHATQNSVPLAYSGPVRLWRSLNSGQLVEVAVGQKTTKKVGDLTFPTWEFNNIDVSSARDPLNKYYFRVTTDGLPSYGNVWSHGADGRTYFPEVDRPTAVEACP